MKKAIILGANGYLGRNFTHFLIDKGYSLALFDMQEKSTDGYSFYKQLNILDKEKLATVNFNVDFVFLFSGLNGTVVGFEKYEDFIQTNEIGTLNILNQLRRCSSKARIIFPSTRLVYQENNSGLISENDNKYFKSIYSLNKFFCENALNIYSQVFGLKYNVFRIGIPYGNLLDNKYNYGTISFFLNKALNAEDITLYGTGESKRTFTHIWDIVNIITESIIKEETVNQIYNIGGEALSLKEVAEAIAIKTNVGVVNVEWPELDYKIEVGNTAFNSDRIDKILNYSYEFNFYKWIENLKLTNK